MVYEKVTDIHNIVPVKEGFAIFSSVEFLTKILIFYTPCPCKSFKFVKVSFFISKQDSQIFFLFFKKWLNFVVRYSSPDSYTI